MENAASIWWKISTSLTLSHPGGTTAIPALSLQNPISISSTQTFRDTSEFSRGPGPDRVSWVRFNSSVSRRQGLAPDASQMGDKCRSGGWGGLEGQASRGSSGVTFLKKGRRWALACGDVTLPDMLLGERGSPWNSGGSSASRSRGSTSKATVDVST